jgi:hypothetical protein
MTRRFMPFYLLKIVHKQGLLHPGHNVLCQRTQISQRRAGDVLPYPTLFYLDSIFILTIIIPTFRERSTPYPQNSVADPHCRINDPILHREWGVYLTSSKSPCRLLHSTLPPKVTHSPVLRSAIRLYIRLMQKHWLNP